MKKFKILNKLKKVIIIMLCTVTVFFSMPKKSKAGILQDFVSLLLKLPDGIEWLLNNSVAGTGGRTSLHINLKGVGTETRGYVYNFDVTPYDIFTSGLEYEVKDMNGDSAGTATKIPILDVNFFKEDTSKSGTVNSAEVLRPVISNVYYSLRNLVLIVMLVILLYVGIRIVIASAVSDQVKYKQWIMDWVVGVCLVVLLQYIMSFMMNVNDIIVDMLGDNREAVYYVSLSQLGGGVGYSDWEEIIEKGEKDTGVNYFIGKHLAIANNDTGFSFDNASATINLDVSENNSTRTDWGDKGTVFINARIVKDEYAVSGVGILSGIATAGVGAGIGTLICPVVGTAIGALGGAIVGVFVEAEVDKGDGEKWGDHAVYRCNIVEYVRLITSFGSKWVVEYKPSGAFSQFITEDGDEANEEEDEEAEGTDLAYVGFYGYAFLYILLVIETLMFLYTYLKRVFKLAFYTMIAPLIAFMYPIDKLGDGKAQAFNTWFKEYLFNVLIQPLHLLLYTIFIYSAMTLMQESIIYAIGAYAYMIAAEKFFKKIFGFDKAPAGGPGALANPALAGAAMNGLDKLKGEGPGGKDKKNGSGGTSGKIKYAKKDKPSSSPANAPAANGAGNARTNRGGFENGGDAPSANGGNPRTPSSSSGRGKVGSTLGGMRKELSRRTARRITGGRSSNLADAIPGSGRSGRFWGSALAGVAKTAVKAGTRGAMTAGGALLGVGAGAIASALSGEDQMIKGVTAGAAVGSALGSRAVSWGEDLYDKGKEWHAHDDPNAAAKLRMEKLQQENPDIMDDLSQEQLKGLETVLAYGDINPDDAEKISKFVENGHDPYDVYCARDMEKNCGDLNNSTNYETAVSREKASMDADEMARDEYIKEQEKIINSSTATADEKNTANEELIKAKDRKKTIESKEFKAIKAKKEQEIELKAREKVEKYKGINNGKKLGEI